METGVQSFQGIERRIAGACGVASVGGSLCGKKDGEKARGEGGAEIARQERNQAAKRGARQGEIGQRWVNRVRFTGVAHER